MYHRAGRPSSFLSSFLLDNKKLLHFRTFSSPSFCACRGFLRWSSLLLPTDDGNISNKFFPPRQSSGREGKQGRNEVEIAPRREFSGTRSGRYLLSHSLICIANYCRKTKRNNANIYSFLFICCQPSYAQIANDFCRTLATLRRAEPHTDNTGIQGGQQLHKLHFVDFDLSLSLVCTELLLIVCHFGERLCLSNRSPFSGLGSLLALCTDIWSASFLRGSLSHSPFVVSLVFGYVALFAQYVGRSLAWDSVGGGYRWRIWQGLLHSLHAGS